MTRRRALIGYSCAVAAEQAMPALLTSTSTRPIARVPPTPCARISRNRPRQPRPELCLSESVRRARGRLGIQVRHDHLTSVRPQTFRDGESDPTGRTGHDRDTRIQLCTVSLCQASSLAIDARTELENAQTVRPDPEADPTWSAGLTAFKLVTVRADDGSRTMMRPRRLDAVTRSRCSASHREVHRRAGGDRRVHSQHDVLGPAVDPDRPRLGLFHASLSASPGALGHRPTGAARAPMTDER